MNKKASLFPLTTSVLGKPPSRADLFWTRSHLIAMTDALNRPLNPYVYMQTIPESTKLRSIVSDLNKSGISLWPVRFTTNLRIASARAALKELRSTLNTILKDYPK